MMLGQEVTVQSRKYDMSIRRTWKCRLVERKDPLLVFIGEFDTDIEHPELGSIVTGTTSYEYYWLDRWYNVFRFLNPDGTFRNFYCNINMPPKFENAVLDYVDLDIDLVIWPDRRIIVLDQDEFEANSRLFGYPQILISQAENARNELIRHIENRHFPFDN